MTSARIEALITKLEKGLKHTSETFTRLLPEQWQSTIYAEPHWDPRNLLAHFVSSEQQLLALAQNVAQNGRGAPEGLVIDAFNAEEQERFRSQSASSLLENLQNARQQTIAWVKTLQDHQLDHKGRHPALGEVSVETMIQTMVGHHLIHLRDFSRQLRSSQNSL